MIYTLIIKDKFEKIINITDMNIEKLRRYRNRINNGTIPNYIDAYIIDQNLNIIK